MWKEFKEFIARGNVMDLAIGLIMGAAFGKIVTSLVEDIVMPPIGMVLGKVNFTDLFVPLSGNPLSLADAKAKALPTINYGLFINTVIQFIIIAFVIFLIIKAINRMKRRPEELPPTLKACSYCFSDIAVQATRCPRCTSQLTA